MKLYHYTLLFVIIAIVIITITDINTNNYNAVASNKREIDKNLETAIDDGINNLIELDSNNNLNINKDKAIQGFLMSIYSSFGILSDRFAQEKLSLYLPVIVITSEDGYHVLYSDEYTDPSGYKNLTKRWSEKLPYYLEDEDFIYSFTLGNTITIYDKNLIIDKDSEEPQQIYKIDYREIALHYAEYPEFIELKNYAENNNRPCMFLFNQELYNEVRKTVISDCLVKSMAYYTSHHNEIAKRHGITYNFSLPLTEDDYWSPYLSNPSMFVVFQGYPYGEGSKYVYNRIAGAGSRISKNNVFYLEQKDWYLLYHLKDCEEFNKPETIIPEDRNYPFYDELSCVEEGAYACPVCIKNGVYPPDYNP